MIKLEFSSEVVKQLHYERRYHPHPRVRQRLEAVYLKAIGYQHQEIGRIVVSVKRPCGATCGCTRQAVLKR